MRMKQVHIALVVFGLSSCLIHAAGDESELMQKNHDWHITSETFSNAPYWLMPTNVPSNLYPLLNGKWVWTTNMLVPWFGGSDNTGVDDDKLRRWEKQQREKWIASIPPGLVNVSEYRGRWNTNMVENWRGVWAEDTNTGWRVKLTFYKTNTPDMVVIIFVGSIVTNSGAGLLPVPDGKFAKLELLDANGKAVPTRRGAALILFQGKSAVDPSSEKAHVNKQPPPSSDDATVEENYPDTISDLKYSRWTNGSFLYYAGFVSNGPPCHVGYFKFNDIFSIKTEGDYTLTLQPVLYRMHNEGGTFQGYLDRVDLPSVTTKVHLVPK